MRIAAFEEKEYEAPLYNQLEAGCPHVWSPGQVFESHVGFDRAILVDSPRFWRLLGRTAPVGAFMNRYDWHFWHDRRRRALPNFSLNLFVQAKRPVYGRPPRRIRTAGIPGPCWCFQADDEQQIALERVAARLGIRAAVVYASPAFNTLSQLYANTKRGTVIENSTFPEVAQLRGHSKWFYNAPGGTGVANPGPEPSSGQFLINRIERLRNDQASRPENSASQELALLAKTIVAALEEINPEQNARVALFFEELRGIEVELRRYEEIGDLVRPFFQVSTFAGMFNLEWYTLK